MYTIRGTVRVPPAKMGSDRKVAVLEELKKLYEGMVDEDLGVIIKVIDVDEVGEGVVVPGDAGVYHEAVYKVLTYKPLLQEVVEGYVTDITEFGAFVRIGPLEGLVHMSQIMDEFVRYDPSIPAFIGKESERRLEVGDIVRARIVSVSLKETVADSKVGLTMRQPGLGKLEWIKEGEKGGKT